MLLMVLWCVSAEEESVRHKGTEVLVLQYRRTMVRDDHNADEIGMCEHVVKTRLIMEISWTGRSVVGHMYWRALSQTVLPTVRFQNRAWRRVSDVLMQANEDTTEITIVDGATRTIMHVRHSQQCRD